VPASLVLGCAVLGATMTPIAVDDALRFRVPDLWVYVALLTGLVWNSVWRLRSDDSLVMAVGIPVVSAAICGGVFLAVREAFFRLRGFDGLGFGDVKLAAAGGAWLSWELFAFAVVVAAVGALGFVGAGALRGRGWSASKRLAFGAFLAPAIWAVWFTFHAAGNG
jgi:leader peptidase (prepilin peptidase)/N-methyltransferase